MTRVEISELRWEIWAYQAGRCGVCGEPVKLGAFQLAHRIPQRKWCIRRWGRRVIHDRRNLVGVCGLYCNARAQVNPDSLQAEAIAAEIEGVVNGA